MRETEERRRDRRSGRRRMRNRRRRAGLRVSLLTVLAVLGAACMLLLIAPQQTSANAPERYKYYATVYVDRDDTLWKISEEYISAEYASVEDHIAEIRSINHISGDRIEYGTRITVPYYSSEYK